MLNVLTSLKMMGLASLETLLSNQCSAENSLIDANTFYSILYDGVHKISEWTDKTITLRYMEDIRRLPPHLPSTIVSRISTCELMSSILIKLGCDTSMVCYSYILYPFNSSKDKPVNSSTTIDILEWLQSHLTILLEANRSKGVVRFNLVPSSVSLSWFRLKLKRYEEAIDNYKTGTTDVKKEHRKYKCHLLNISKNHSLSHMEYIHNELSKQGIKDGNCYVSTLFQSILNNISSNINIPSISVVDTDIDPSNFMHNKKELIRSISCKKKVHTVSNSRVSITASAIKEINFLMLNPLNISSNVKCDENYLIYPKDKEEFGAIIKEYETYKQEYNTQLHDIRQVELELEHVTNALSEAKKGESLVIMEQEATKKRIEYRKHILHLMDNPISSIHILKSKLEELKQTRNEAQREHQEKMDKIELKNHNSRDKLDQVEIPERETIISLKESYEKVKKCMAKLEDETKRLIQKVEQCHKSRYSNMHMDRNVYLQYITDTVNTVRRQEMERIDIKDKCAQLNLEIKHANNDVRACFDKLESKISSMTKARSHNQCFIEESYKSIITLRTIYLTLIDTITKNGEAKLKVHSMKEMLRKRQEIMNSIPISEIDQNYEQITTEYNMAKNYLNSLNMP